MNHISSSNFAVHYQGIGILENNFQDFGPNFRINPTVGVGVGNWDGYGGIKKIQIDETFIINWEIIDWITNNVSPGILAIPGAIAPQFTVTHTFKRIKIDSSEDLEFFNGDTETAYVFGGPADTFDIQVGTATEHNFIDKLAIDFFSPARYEHVITLKSKVSDCYDIEEKFIYDFEFNRQVFQIDIANRFYLGEKLEFTLKNFIVQQPGDLLTRLHIRYCVPPFPNNLVEEIDCSTTEPLEFNMAVNVRNIFKNYVLILFRML